MGIELAFGLCACVIVFGWAALIAILNISYVEEWAENFFGGNPLLEPIVLVPILSSLIVLFVGPSCLSTVRGIIVSAIVLALVFIAILAAIAFGFALHWLGERLPTVFKKKTSSREGDV